MLCLKPRATERRDRDFVLAEEAGQKGGVACQSKLEGCQTQRKGRGKA